MNERSHLTADYNLYFNTAGNNNRTTDLELSRTKDHTAHDTSLLEAQEEDEQKDPSPSGSCEGESFPLMTAPFITEREHPNPEYDEDKSTVEYLFTGKLTLFPLTILFLGVGAGVLLLQGNKPYLHGYFESTEVYYGITGLLLALLAVGFFVALMLCIVLKISFSLNPETLVIKKHGVFRSTTLEFAVNRTSLHYFRTHFSDEQAWLQLVIKEGNQFYQIFSWKGKGNQKDRFLKLFVTLQNELSKWQARSRHYYVLPRMQDTSTSTEIVSKKEINLLSPFTHRLQALSKTLQSDSKRLEGISNRKATALCIEDIPVINLDRFFQHFGTNKPPLHERGTQ